MDWQRYDDALVLESSGKADEALEELQALQSFATEPYDKGLLLGAIANCLRTLHRYDEAQEFADKACAMVGETHPEYPSAFFISASIAAERGEWISALTKLDFLLEKYPHISDPESQDLYSKILGARGTVLIELERYAEARPLLEKELVKQMNPQVTLYYLGVCCFHMGDYEEAERYLKEQLSHATSNEYIVRAHFCLANVYYHRKQYAWARLELEWCLGQNSGQVPKNLVIKGLVNSSLGLGLNDDAKRYADMLEVTNHNS